MLLQLQADLENIDTDPLIVEVMVKKLHAGYHRHPLYLVGDHLIGSAVREQWALDWYIFSVVKFLNFERKHNNSGWIGLVLDGSQQVPLGPRKL